MLQITSLFEKLSLDDSPVLSSRKVRTRKLSECIEQYLSIKKLKCQSPRNQNTNESSSSYRSPRFSTELYDVPSIQEPKNIIEYIENLFIGGNLLLDKSLNKTIFNNMSNEDLIRVIKTHYLIPFKDYGENLSRESLLEILLCWVNDEFP